MRAEIVGGVNRRVDRFGADVCEDFWIAKTELRGGARPCGIVVQAVFPGSAEILAVRAIFSNAAGRHE